MGDPAGVGPEVCVGAWPSIASAQGYAPFLIGHPAIFERAIKLLDLNHTVKEIATPEEAGAVFVESSGKTIPCLSICEKNAINALDGAVSKLAGQAAFDAVSVAADLAISKRIDAIVTAPLCKESLQAAGHDFPGHTELLADRCGVEDFAMMLYLPPSEQVLSPNGLCVVHATLHMALRKVFDVLTSELIFEKCKLVHNVMQKFGCSEPRIGVCSLNPHAGENGLFGNEEETIILPGIKAARKIGLNVIGPTAADALIPAAKNGSCDAVVAMYHDQGHVAVKLLGIDHAVNVTLGLPIIRTSVAHGTAFDIAWQNKANPAGIAVAVETAFKLVNAK